MKELIHFDSPQEWGVNGVQDLIIDLVNALSAVKSLSEINCEIADEKTVIRQALAGLLRNQDMERCSFFVFDADGLLKNVTGLSVEDVLESAPSWTVKSMSFRLGEGIIGTAASTGEIQQCHDCAKDERFAKYDRQIEPMGSIICAPVYTLHHVLIGVLNISHPIPNFFTDWHVRLIEIYTNILGQLITNRRLFQQMELQITARTSELQRLVEETRQLKDHYINMSMHDPLTGLHNRRYFYDQIELALSQHKRYQLPFCVLVMDVDFFKSINDRFGHVFGDQVLISVAHALKQEVRSTDILVRFGGEEFVIIFTNASCENGKIFAERIRSHIKALRWDNEDKIANITISIGMYCVNPGMTEKDTQLDIDQIIHCADTALYAAKENGRDRVEVFTDCC
jgi:diguanylate cyclase (GGDEF)-like protein